MRISFYRIGIIFMLLFCLSATMGLCAEKVKVGIAYDVGGIEQDFNALAYNGALQAQAEMPERIEVISLEPSLTSTNVGLVQNLIALKCDVVIGVGSGFADSLAKAAARNTTIKFVLIDDKIEYSGENLLCLTFKDQEGAYLAGAAAALKSQTGKIGFIGGAPTPALERFKAGYSAGARSVNPNIIIFADFIGDKLIAFKNAYRAKDLALDQIKRGADVVFHVAGFAGIGVIDAATMQDVLAIGVDVDQSLTVSEKQREHLLTSAVKRIDNGIYDTIKAVCRNEFVGGSIELGIKENGVDYVINSYNASLLAEIQDKLEQIKADIVNESVIVPESL